MVQEVVHPTAGRIKLTGPAVKYSAGAAAAAPGDDDELGGGDSGGDSSSRASAPTGMSAQIRSAPPVHGQHSFEVLQEVLEMSAPDIHRLAKAGVIRCAEMPPRVRTKE